MVLRRVVRLSHACLHISLLHTRTDGGLKMKESPASHTSIEREDLIEPSPTCARS